MSGSLRFSSRFIIGIISMILVVAGVGCGTVIYEDLTPEDIPVVVEHFSRDDDSYLFHQASRALHDIGSMEGGVDTLIILLKDDDPEMRSNAAMILGYIISEGDISLDENPALIPSLLDIFSDDNPDVRLHAVKAIGFCDSSQDEFTRSLPVIIDALGRVLNDDNESVRDEAVLTLDTIEPCASDVIDDLLELLIKYGDFLVQLDAAMALAEQGANVHMAVPVLIDCLENGDLYLTERNDDSLTLQYYPIAGNCAYCLGLIGEDAIDSIPDLIELTGSENITERRYSIDAVVKIDPDGELVIPLLIDRLESDIPLVRESSAMLLGMYGQEAEKALPMLTELLDDESTAVRREVSTAIEVIDVGDN